MDPGRVSRAALAQLYTKSVYLPSNDLNFEFHVFIIDSN